MRTRKGLIPWLTHSSAGLRTGAYSADVAGLAKARIAVGAGNTQAALSALRPVLGARYQQAAFGDPEQEIDVSPAVHRRQQLYWYEGPNWSSVYEQKHRPVNVAVYDVYQQLKAGAKATDQLSSYCRKYCRRD